MRHEATKNPAPLQTMYAHLIQNLKKKPFPYILIITPTTSPRDAVSTWQVINKREARTLAKEAAAKPWNF